MQIDRILKSVEKPARYVGGEFGQIIKEKSEVDTRFAFCFPDTYEIGMSNLGVRILYGVLNEREKIWCERCYAPWIDMAEKMEEENIPLFALESKDPLCEFDFVGFTLQYELCYTTVLKMLSLAGIPLLAQERGEDFPIIIGGGPCAYNPEPVAEFFDLFSIGEGEESLPEIVELYRSMKKEEGYTKEKFLRAASHLEGCYVPSLYEAEYKPDGTLASFTPKYPDVPEKIMKRIVRDMDTAYYPPCAVMPYIETVHDRIMLEVCRGCYRGCRFCQAGMTYRPVRRKTPAVLNSQARTIQENTGYSEISLSSLSISDYPPLDELTGLLTSWTDEKKVSLSLPSMRADSFTKELMEKMSSVRTGGLTFAPEAGSQRLRDVINKNVTKEDILNACGVAFEGGKTSVKLYFMEGLPTENEDDLDGIYDIAKSVIDKFYSLPRKKGTRQVGVTVSVACFVPKPHTPFQWDGQDDLETLCEKQQYLKKQLFSDRKIRYNWHDAEVSRLEAVFARGSRRLTPVLLEAAKRGVCFDGWSECFSYENWLDIFSSVGIDPGFFANREFGEDELLPWDMIDIGVSREFLLRERHLSREGKITPDCSQKCSGCGANCLGGERTCCP